MGVRLCVTTISGNVHYSKKIEVVDGEINDMKESLKQIVRLNFFSITLENDNELFLNPKYIESVLLEEYK